MKTRAFRRRRPARLQPLEVRLALTSPTSLTIPLDPTLDQFGDQVVTVQAFGDTSRATFGLFDTGASAVTFSADDQTLFEFLNAGIPIKTAGGAQASGIGGAITGDLSQPGTILADGLHSSGLSFDSQGFPVFNFTLGTGGANADNVQAMVGTQTGSPSLPTITGTPVMNPSQADPNGLAARIDFQGETLDFSDVIPGLKLTVPDLHYVAPGSTLTTVPGTTTTPATVPLILFGDDNHNAPGNSITNSPSPMQPDVQLVDQGHTVGGQHMLLDTGSQLTVISPAAATSLGLDLKNPTTSIDVQGVGGTETVPGFTLDELDVPTSDGGQIKFTNVPAYVLTIAPGVDGLLGTNLWDTASSLLYDPFNPAGSPTMELTFQTTPDRSGQLDSAQLAKLQGADASFFGNAFGGASVAVHQLPDFALPASLTATATAVSATEGATFHGTVATLSDSNTSATAGDFTATIDWGDGQSSTGTVTAAASGFLVTGAHVYADESASRSITMIVADKGGAKATAIGTATVSDAALSATAASVAATEGMMFNGTIATFSDANASPAAGDFTATINWGDGQSSTGTVTAAATGFVVTGAHVYADESASRSITMIVADNGGAKATATGTATVSDAALSATAASVAATEGMMFNGTIATFSDANASPAAGDFTATIDWGDGQSSTGTVTAAATGFVVTGAHVYAEESASRSVTMIVADKGGAKATATSTATVSDAALSATAASVAATEGMTSNGTIATFSDANASASIGDFSATIDWGDGQSSTGTITSAANGFVIAGTHAYSAAGSFPVIVTVNDVGGGNVTATASASVSSSPTTTPNQRFVAAVYLDLLGRPIDPNAASYWNGRLAQGLDRTALADTILASGEYQQTQIDDLFQTYLHRHADPQATDFFMTSLASGGTPQQISATLLGSNEYFQSEGRGDNSAFLRDLFADVLHRPIDTGAENYFAQALAHGVARSQIAAQVLASNEHQRDLVDGWFLQYLGRAVDHGGQTYFASRLEHGAAPEQLIASIVGSKEFYGRGG